MKKLSITLACAALAVTAIAQFSTNNTISRIAPGYYVGTNFITVSNGVAFATNKAGNKLPGYYNGTNWIYLTNSSPFTTNKPGSITITN